jgi:hypothetical protein
MARKFLAYILAFVLSLKLVLNFESIRMSDYLPLRFLSEEHDRINQRLSNKISLDENLIFKEAEAVNGTAIRCLWLEPTSLSVFNLKNLQRSIKEPNV